MLRVAIKLLCETLAPKSSAVEIQLPPKPAPRQERGGGGGGSRMSAGAYDRARRRSLIRTRVRV